MNLGNSKRPKHLPRYADHAQGCRATCHEDGRYDVLHHETAIPKCWTVWGSPLNEQTAASFPPNRCARVKWLGLIWRLVATTSFPHWRSRRTATPAPMMSHAAVYLGWQTNQQHKRGANVTAATRSSVKLQPHREPRCQADPHCPVRKR
jgi:hypothetical protein